MFLCTYVKNILKGWLTPPLQITPSRLRRTPSLKRGRARGTACGGGVCCSREPMISNANSNKTGTVKKHNGGPVCCRPLCEACLKISAGINCFLYSRANQGSAAPCNRRRGCNGKGGLTEECRMRLVSKEPSDCFFRVPGVLVLLRNKST